MISHSYSKSKSANNIETTLPKKLVGKLLLNSDARFWGFNCIGWLGISIISFFSLNLWYDQPDSTFLGHNLAQSLLGILITWPMRHIFRSIWNMSSKQRITFVLLTVLILSFIWTISRLALFQVMTDIDLWSDFGGWYYSSIFIFVCWAAFYHTIKYYQLLEYEHKELLELEAEQSEKNLQLAKAESTAREAQLKMLRYQINPHFLFNTLNSVQALISTGREEQASTMVNDLSGFLRFSLDNDALQMITVEQEIEILQQYLSIEKIRFGDRLHVDYLIAHETKTALIPSMLLQPLVENSIKYAVSQSQKTTVISIKVSFMDDRLHIEVSDTGKGFPEEIVSKDGVEGIGLKNTEQRLATFFLDDFTLKLSNKMLSGAVVTIDIPIQH